MSRPTQTTRFDWWDAAQNRATSHQNPKPQEVHAGKPLHHWRRALWWGDSTVHTTNKVKGFVRRTYRFPLLPPGQDFQTDKCRGSDRGRQLIDTFSVHCTDTFLLSEQSGHISCLPLLQSVLFVLGHVSSCPSPPPPPTPLVLTEQRVTEQRYCHIVSSSSAWAQKLSKLYTRATYRYLRFSRSSNAPLGILRIWLLLRRLWRTEYRVYFIFIRQSSLFMAKSQLLALADFWQFVFWVSLLTQFSSVLQFEISWKFDL